MMIFLMNMIMTKHQSKTSLTNQRMTDHQTVITPPLIMLIGTAGKLYVWPRRREKTLPDGGSWSGPAGPPGRPVPYFGRLRRSVITLDAGLMDP